jgi:hypothetical protein
MKRKEKHVNTNAIGLRFNLFFFVFSGVLFYFFAINVIISDLD